MSKQFYKKRFRNLYNFKLCANLGPKDKVKVAAINAAFAKDRLKFCVYRKTESDL